MSALSQRIERARELRVEAGGYVFICRRPTALEWIERSKSSQARIALDTLIGWERVKELDLVPGGDGAEAPFDRDAAAAWLSDRIDLLGIIAAEVVKAIEAYAESIGELRKN